MTSEIRRMAAALEDGVREWVLEGFQPQFGKLTDSFESNERWSDLQSTGTALWLDSGDLEGSRKLWTQEFRALTTNNTLLNKEVQRGQYDELVRKTAERLRGLEPKIPRELLVQEIVFVLNAYHGLRLVEAFDAYVSVEEHTDLAHDAELATLYGKRFHAICPQRFIVKLPLTPDGLVGMRALRQAGVPINFTLGFSARQNFLAARFGSPSFVNVFLGRLNTFVSDEKLGSGDGVGEKATAASQEAIAGLRAAGAAQTRQIAASMRSGEQVWTLAGTDVMTMPLAVAQEYVDSDRASASRRGPHAATIQPDIDATARASLGVDSLWDLSPEFRHTIDALMNEDVDRMTGVDIVEFLHQNGVVDLFPRYTPEDLSAFATDGKIPKLARWRARLESGQVALDSLFNQSGLYSFAADQKALDDRVRGLLG